jgi:hypothetical protein
MNEKKLTDKLREHYRKDVLGDRSVKTVEKALQEALDNTTPEHPGSPDYDPFESEEQDDYSEWI